MRAELSGKRPRLGQRGRRRRSIVSLEAGLGLAPERNRPWIRTLDRSPRLSGLAPELRIVLALSARQIRLGLRPISVLDRSRALLVGGADEIGEKLRTLAGLVADIVVADVARADRGIRLDGEPRSGDQRDPAGVLAAELNAVDPARRRRAGSIEAPRPSLELCLQRGEQRDVLRFK